MVTIHAPVLMICTTFNFPNELAKTLPCIINAVSNRSDTQCVIIDNHSKDPAVHQQLDAVNHPNIAVLKNTINQGKAIAVNAFLAQYVTTHNCPHILISMDPDLVFDTQSFDDLVACLNTVPNLGMLSMRYKKNAYNPERSVWRPSQKFTGIDGQVYWIRRPVFANVPGGFFGVQGYVLHYYLNYKLFPQTKNTANFNKGYIQRAGSDDAYLYDYLKKYSLTQGYLEGTQIEHLKSPPQTKNYIR
jgi:glycosyltransferase involved in cell wall biosynthesis